MIFISYKVNLIIIKLLNTCTYYYLIPIQFNRNRNVLYEWFIMFGLLHFNCFIFIKAIVINLYLN